MGGGAPCLEVTDRLLRVRWAWQPVTATLPSLRQCGRPGLWLADCDTVTGGCSHVMWPEWVSRSDGPENRPETAGAGRDRVLGPGRLCGAVMILALLPL